MYAYPTLMRSVLIDLFEINYKIHIKIIILIITSINKGFINKLDAISQHSHTPPVKEISGGATFAHALTQRKAATLRYRHLWQNLDVG